MKKLTKITGIVVILGSVLTCHLSADPIQDVNQEMEERAIQCGQKRDYSGMDALLSEIDTKYKDGRSVAYLRELSAIQRCLFKNWDPSRPDADVLWMYRKIQWKLFLASYSRPADARDFLGGQTFDATRALASGHFARNLDREQFVALRNDAVALLKAYGDSLRARIMPGYVYKPGHGMHSGVAANVFPQPQKSSLLAQLHLRQPNNERIKV